MTQPAPGQSDPNAGQPDPNAAGETDPNAQSQESKPVEEQLAELSSQLETLKQNSRKWETRAKENKAAADKLAQLEAANATPDQQLQAAVEKAAKAETELARYRVAHEVQLPAALLSLLNGDEDQMREQAKALIEFRGQAPKPTVKPDPTQGGSGSPQKPSAAEAGRAEAQRRIAARTKKS